MTTDEYQRRKKKQKAFEWHDSQVETLIEAWSHEPVLYNSSHEEYHIKDKRRLAIEHLLTRIQTDFESPFPSGEEIVRKLANIRCYFVAEKNKTEQSKTSGSGTDNIYKTKWQFFDRLAFLSDNVTPRNTHSNIRNRAVAYLVDQDDDSGDGFTTDRKQSFGRKARKTEMNRTNQLIEAAVSYLHKPKPSATPATQVNDSDKLSDSLFGKMIGNMLQEIPCGHSKDMLKLEMQKMVLQVKYDAQRQSVAHPEIWPQNNIKMPGRARAGEEGNASIGYGCSSFSSPGIPMSYGDSGSKLVSNSLESPLTFTEFMKNK